MATHTRNHELFKELSILCVEDEDGVRESLSEFLERRFNKVYTAENGQLGYESYKENQPDIIMTDIQMPVLNGLDMAKKIREENQEIPIIIVSAFNDISYLQDAIEIGVHSYVSKPVDSRKMTETLYRSAQRVKYQDMVKVLKDNEELFRAVTENSPTGICLYKQNFIYTNWAFQELTGFSQTELLSMNAEEYLLKNQNSCKNHLEGTLDGKPFDTYLEIDLQTKDDKTKFLDITTCSIDYKGEVMHIANIRDITERKWFEDELEDKQHILERLNKELEENIELVKQKNIELATQLYTDKLTGLPNRFKLLEDIKESNAPALVILNLDSFKEINDFYGDKIGDFVLSEIAQRLHNYESHYSVKLYKLQADEYALFTDGGIAYEDLKELVGKVHDNMEEQLIYLNEQEIHIGITAGISIGERDKLFAQADMALKSAKMKRKSFLFYDESMKVMKEFEQNIKWLHTLRNALDNERLIAYYQPIFSNVTGKVEKFECLARLIDEQGKIHTPYYFIDISKRSRLYSRITRSVIQNAFGAFKHNNYQFSVNLSIEDIQDDETMNYIFNLLHQEPDVAKRLIFEIVESEGIDNYEIVKDFIANAKKYECQIAIDDFGSGYSNFAHTLKMDVDHIKIDASLVKNADTDENSKIICQTIVDFSKRLDIKTIAEYVHSQSVLDTVKSFGVDFSQGYFLGEPVSEVK